MPKPSRAIIIALPVLLITGCASTTTQTVNPTMTAPADPAPTETSTESLNIPKAFKQSKGTANITITSAKYVPNAPYTKNGGKLTLEILWETTDGTTTSSAYFQAKDAEGRSGQFAISDGPSLGNGEVPQGDKSRGELSFDIGEGPFIITAANGALGEEQARWTFTGR